MLNSAKYKNIYNLRVNSSRMQRVHTTRVPSNASVNAQEQNRFLQRFSNIKKHLRNRLGHTDETKNEGNQL